MSHANPEDNAVALWFATQLANEGYIVWCDVAKLIGGEDFWGDIEDVIREHAVKVVYLLSRTSNVKDGCLRELHLAQAMARKEGFDDFVVPLRIDDIPHSDINIRVSPLNVIDGRSWSSGLQSLLRKLDHDRTPRGEAKDFRQSSAWWKERFATSRSVRTEQETLYSNWFRIENPALQFHWHRVRRSGLGPLEFPTNLPWPAFEASGGLWTFAPAEAVSAHLPSPYYIDETVTKTITASEEVEKTARDSAFQLVRLTWERHLQSRGLIGHELANEKRCFAFPLDLIPNDEIAFESPEGKRGRRAVVGYKTRVDSEGKSWLRYWHYAIQPIATFQPQLLIMVRAHVLFSSDGKTIWESADRLQKARRNQCKGWWNDAWRDRVLAAMSWLAGNDASILLETGAEPLRVDSRPLSFDSPVIYLDRTKAMSDYVDDVHLSEADHIGEDDPDDGDDVGRDDLTSDDDQIDLSDDTADDEDP